MINLHNIQLDPSYILFWTGPSAAPHICIRPGASRNDHQVCGGDGTIYCECDTCWDSPNRHYVKDAIDLRNYRCKGCNEGIHPVIR